MARIPETTLYSYDLFPASCPRCQSPPVIFEDLDQYRIECSSSTCIVSSGWWDVLEDAIDEWNSF